MLIGTQIAYISSLQQTSFKFRKLPVQFPVSMAVQLWWLMWRGVKKLYRSWQAELLQYCVTLIFAIVIAFFFFRLGNNQEDLTPRLGLLFYSIARA